MFEDKVKTKSDAELRDIVSKPKDYQPAFLVAVLNEIEKREILIDKQAVNDILSKQEKVRIESEGRWKIPSDLHPNLKLASNLTFISIGIGLINRLIFILLLGVKMTEPLSGILSIAITAALGFGIRLGISGIRYVLLVLFLAGSVVGYIFISFLFQNAPIAAILSLIPVVIELYVLLLLFKKETNNWYKHSIKLD